MTNILIMGAAGRDAHPAALAGHGYPEGIPIVPEEELDRLLEEEDIDEVVFAYSDVSLGYVEKKRQQVEAHGVRFSTFDVDATMLPSSKPVIAVTAVRTGCGKSQVARRITDILRGMGKTAVVVRHPMPYGALEKQAMQRFASYEDLADHDCTIEEREEYEPHIANGTIVYAGADYEAILREAEKEADVIVWDGGNNDTPFFKPDLWITVADPHRPGHELEFFPGSENFARADLILINKAGSADPADIETVAANAARVNPSAEVIRRESTLEVPDPAIIEAVEDGPTTTHGGMPFGAGTLAARKHGAAALVDPRPWAVGEIAGTFAKYPEIGPLLPAMGYGEAQVRDLEATIRAVDCDLVLVATPIDLTRLIDIDKPNMRIRYYLAAADGALAAAVEATI